VSVAFVDLAELRDAPFDAAALSAGVEPFLDSLVFGGERERFMRHAVGSTLAILDASARATLQDRWERVEAERWPRWDAGLDRPYPAHQWTWGPAALVLSRAIRPAGRCCRARLSQWLGWLPAGHPLPDVLGDLRRRVAGVEWSVGAEPQRRAALLGLRLVLAGGYQGIGEITDGDLKAVPVEAARGVDLLDAVLCDVGALGRTPLAGRARRPFVDPAAVPGRTPALPGDLRAAHLRCLRHDPAQAQLAGAPVGRSWTSASRRSTDQPTSAGRTRRRSSARHRARPGGAAPPPDVGARRGPADRAPVADRCALLL
jgi:hypothetical protein